MVQLYYKDFILSGKKIEKVPWSWKMFLKIWWEILQAINIKLLEAIPFPIEN